MKKTVGCIFIILSFFIFNGCQQVNEPRDTYVTNTINIIWKGSFSFEPSNPEIGWAYYDITKKMSFVWDGLTWQVIAQDGKSIIWKGELSSAPANPQENWAYYNSLDGNSYIFNGYAWDYLARAGKDGISGIMLWLGAYEVAPLNPSEGYCYYNTIESCSYIWNGSSWDILAKDGCGITWKGALYSAPLEPQINWAYYDINKQTSYIWNGSSWDILSQSVGGNTNVIVSVVWRGSFTTAPSDPTIGDAYYNSTLKASYIFDGSVWQQISKDGQDGTYSYSGTGYLISWKGSLSSNPSNPQAGWAYYNSTDKKSYIYDGSSWQIISQDGNYSSNESDTGRTVYLGETTEEIDGITYIVKKYADVYGGSDYYYTIYKNYYLNNKLKRTWMASHNAGCVDLDYTYHEYVEHLCGVFSSVISITDFYDSGKIKNYYQQTQDNIQERKFSEDGFLLEFNVISNAVKYYTTYYSSGYEKTYKYYLPTENDFYLYIDAEYFDEFGKSIRKSITYNTDGNYNTEQYYYEPNKKQLVVSYNSDGTVSNFQYYYESGYLQYYYSNSGFLYTYDDGKTITTSTSSDIYISKSSFTDSQAKSKISSLRPE